MPADAKIKQLELNLRNAKRNAETCMRCCGAGGFNKYKHIKNGVCFACGGSGRSRRSDARIREAIAELNAARKAA